MRNHRNNVDIRTNKRNIKRNVMQFEFRIEDKLNKFNAILCETGTFLKDNK